LELGPKLVLDQKTDRARKTLDVDFDVVLACVCQGGSLTAGVPTVETDANLFDVDEF
jgi:hypothetical protein